jgi:hypothetical protein
MLALAACRRPACLPVFLFPSGSDVAFGRHVSGKLYEIERRHAGVGDRRKQSRNGRRGSEPRRNWRRAAWLFAAYVAYVCLRALPDGIRRYIKRTET